jgi:TolB-like protein/tetratricopeptide (TPR) repeat protein
MGLVSELRRRNVLRMAVLYVVAAWLIMQVAGVLIDLGSLPEWTGPIILPLLAVGFPIALIVSWFYELTPEGISLEKDVEAAESITHATGRRMDFLVISLLCAAVILFAYDKWWIGPAPEKSIAVLPFENMSADPEQEYFSDGISEELLNLLAKIPELTVISRSSAFSFKGKGIAIPTVAAQLNVAHVLEGSVRKTGNRVRINAQLIEASSDSHLWSETYDRELDDIFAVQDEIAAAISNALKVKLTLAAGEVVQPTVIKAANTAAYDAYLRGRELIHHGGREAMEDAVHHLERSLRLDNDFAPAHAQLAIATVLLTTVVMSPRQEARRKAVLHLDHAQELEPDLAEAHLGRALVAHYSSDNESTVEHARKALASNPNYIDAMVWLQDALGHLGRYEETDTILERMLVTDPLSDTVRAEYAHSLGGQGRTEEAHELADQLLAQNPTSAYWVHADTFLWSEGKLAESLSWALRSPASNSAAMFAFALVGEYDEARRISAKNALWVDVAERRWDDAIRTTQSNLQLYPDSEQWTVIAAEVMFLAGRIDEALPLYERALNFVHEGRPLPQPIPLAQTMWLASARRNVGDEGGAQAAVQIARQDHAARRAAGEISQYQYLAEAMFAAFEHDPDRAITALESAIQRGLRITVFIDNAIFEDLQDEPRFVALREELDAILAAEHDKVLQLICFHNPAPDQWQPMPETCDGVVEQSSL